LGVFESDFYQELSLALLFLKPVLECALIPVEKHEKNLSRVDVNLERVLNVVYDGVYFDVHIVVVNNILNVVLFELVFGIFVVLLGRDL